MKKIIIINLAALLFVSSAFAAGSVALNLGDTGKTLYGGKVAGDAATAGAAQKLIGKTSTGVSVGILSNITGYALISQHKQGIKAYGSSHDSTAIFMSDVVAGTEKTPVTPSAIGTVDFIASANKWTSM